MRRFLSRAAQWWNRRQESSPKLSSRRPSVRLRMEELEDRRLMTITYHGGPLIQNVQVEPVYIGTQWTTDPGLQMEASAINHFFNTILNNGVIVGQLKEYNVGNQTISGGKFIGSDFTNVNPAFVTTIDDSEIQQILANQVALAKLPAPTENTLYFVFTGPGVTVTLGGGTGFLGYHNSFQLNGKNLVYATIVDPTITGDITTNLPMNNFQTLTTVVSHELREAITDPVQIPVITNKGLQLVGSGWQDLTPTIKNLFEVCDGPMQPDNGFYLGYGIQAYYSVKRNIAIYPPGTTFIPPAVDMTAKGVTNVSGSEGAMLTNTLGTFSDFDLSGSGTDGVCQPTDFKVTINWGDGTAPTQGTAAFDPNNVTDFIVSGNHIYTKPGTFTVSVVVQDLFDGTSAKPFTTTATIVNGTHGPLHKDTLGKNGLLQVFPVKDGSGLQNIFGLTSDGKFVEYQSSSASNNWSGWTTLPAVIDPLTQIAVGLNADGTFLVVGMDNAGEIDYTNQLQAGGGFLPWADLETNIAVPNVMAVGTNQDGSLIFFYLDLASNNILALKETAPNSNFFTPQFDLTPFGFATTLSVGTNSNGLLQVFSLGPIGEAQSIIQLTPNSLNFGPIADLGGSFVNLAVGANKTGSLQIFGTNAQGALSTAVQTTPGGQFGSFSFVAADFGSGQFGSPLAVGTTADGRLEVFGVQPTFLDLGVPPLLNVVAVTQKFPNATIFNTPAVSLGNLSVSSLVAGKDAQGRPEIFGLGSADNQDYYQASDANNNWLGWIKPV